MTTSAPATKRRARRSRSSLAIIERAYRGSLEEQYGHIVWLSRVMHAMGARTGLLLKGDTVMYGRRAQPHVALMIGDLQIRDLSHYETTLMRLLADGAPVFAWQPDCERLGIDGEALIDGIQAIGAAELAALVGQYDSVWYW